MQHADKLVECIIFLEDFPNMQVLDPLHIGQNVKEVALGGPCPGVQIPTAIHTIY